MLPKGSNVLAYYLGRTAEGQPIDMLGSEHDPAIVTIGDHRVPVNVSYALATMEQGEIRKVKSVYRIKGGRPAIAEYEVCLVGAMKLGFIEDETLHGSECACGCHKLREAFAFSKYPVEKR